MRLQSGFLPLIFVVSNFSCLVQAEPSVSCRVLASDYARAQRSKEVFVKSIDSQKKNCESAQSARLSDVLLGRQRLESCLREIETEKKQLQDQSDGLQKKIKNKIANAPLGAPEIEDCKRALDPVNLENSPNVAPESQR